MSICSEHRIARWNDVATHANKMLDCPYCQLTALKRENEKYKSALEEIVECYNNFVCGERVLAQIATKALENSDENKPN